MRSTTALIGLLAAVPLLQPSAPSQRGRDLRPVGLLLETAELAAAGQPGNAAARYGGSLGLPPLTAGLPLPTPTKECPMPISRADSLHLAPMPIARVDIRRLAPMPVAKPGCTNPLFR